MSKTFVGIARYPLIIAALCASGIVNAQEESPPAADRKAILAMQGEYEVDFSFDETVVLQPGYERASAKRSGASEAVIVVEDSPEKIVLQHLLVDPKNGHVTKHWRQDWTYQAPSRFEFSADQTWSVRALAPEQTRGAWTQCVYEVSDAPRYCGTGRWRHEGGIATWTSDSGWRPLPRREYTVRSDYNALAVVNRHTITADGWTHEQFNTKVRRAPDGDRALVREFGFNDYRKTDQVDFEPAYDYWNATADFWARVRARWAERLAAPPGLRLKTQVDGMALIVPLFELAQRAQTGKRIGDRAIDKPFKRWVTVAD